MLSFFRVCVTKKENTVTFCLLLWQKYVKYLEEKKKLENTTPFRKFWEKENKKKTLAFIEAEALGLKIGWLHVRDFLADRKSFLNVCPESCSYLLLDQSTSFVVKECLHVLQITRIWPEKLNLIVASDQVFYTSWIAENREEKREKRNLLWIASYENLIVAV